MDNKGVIGTIIWIIFLFLIVSSFFFFLSMREGVLRGSSENRSDANQSIDEEINFSSSRQGSNFTDKFHSLDS